MTTKKRFYMHTIDGKPAYMERDQLVFAHVLPHWRDEYDPAKLCGTLDQIKADQDKSRRWRDKQGFDKEWDYGYVVVEVP